MTTKLTDLYIAPVSGGTAIKLYPTYGYNEQININSREFRTQGSQLNIFKVKGGHFSVKLPLLLVSSEDANTINTWWENQELLYFSENGGLYDGTIKVQINNNTKPFPIHSEMVYNRFDGTLELISVKDYYDDNLNKLVKTSGTVFILGDANFGILGINILG